MLYTNILNQKNIQRIQFENRSQLKSINKNRDKNAAILHYNVILLSKLFLLFFAIFLQL